MTGSLQIKNGMYSAVLNLKDEHGQRKQKRISLNIEAVPGNKRKAEKAFRDVLADYETRHITVYRKDVLFCDFINVWMDEARGNLQPNTYEAYQANIDKHLFPYFRETGVNLADITYGDIKGYYTAKSKTLSGNTLKKHHAIVRQVLRKAVQEGLITSNPAAEITLPKAKKFTGSFLTVEQGNALLEAVGDSVMEPVIVLAMMYGLRRSEIAGMKWDAIDFANDTLTVRHTRTRFKTELAKDETKNKSSHRTLPLNRAAKTYLLQLRARQSEEKLFLGQAYKDTPYICRWPDGHAMSPDYMSARFKKLLKRYGLPEIRLHDCRHSCASYMLKAGCSMKEISDFLGHADIGTSMNLYAHLDAESKRDVSNRLGSLLSIASKA